MGLLCVCVQLQPPLPPAGTQGGKVGGTAPPPPIPFPKPAKTLPTSFSKSNGRGSERPHASCPSYPGLFFLFRLCFLPVCFKISPLFSPRTPSHPTSHCYLHFSLTFRSPCSAHSHYREERRGIPAYFHFRMGATSLCEPGSVTRTSGAHLGMRLREGTRRRGQHRRRRLQSIRAGGRPWQLFPPTPWKPPFTTM